MDPVRRLVESRPDFFANRPAHLERAIGIRDFIWQSSGLSNAYMVVTPAGRVIINTGMGWEAPTHKRLFDAVCAGPTPYILLTQGHVDHVGGVALFREPGTKLIAQRNLPLCQRDDQRIKQIRESQAGIWFGEAFAAARRPQPSTAGSAAAPPVQDVPTADISFEDSYEFELGGLRFELYATPGGETIDSCAVWLPQHGILFSGNMLGPLFPHFPNFNTIRGDRYRFVEPYLESLRRVRALEPELLITGHFAPIEGRDLIRACFDRLDAAVDYVHRRTLEGMNAGRDIWTLMREIELPPELYVGQGYGKVSWAVRTIWEQYMGWFKAQATSELYPTQPREIHGDLVALAGLEAVLSRGREKLTSGDPEAAMLFAEAALAYDSRARGALELARDANRALLERSGGDNFWETGWLRTQIQRLEEEIRA
ncbi:MAG TPA: MBL fold metallo-hydrolase [Steroidobacter sp.]|jgi:glyoxylase-like metal-dependent hydrolase (beta-lactamase superfamily II)|nr:alkyl sulfatase dimerization domain-containing protein [Steroidobacteraceae bacterium]HLS83000.1 MBL fold metallo-hydrolase [Steroidobacter sp.]